MPFTPWNWNPTPWQQPGAPAPKPKSPYGTIKVGGSGPRGPQTAGEWEIPQGSAFAQPSTAESLAGRQKESAAISQAGGYGQAGWKQVPFSGAPSGTPTETPWKNLSPEQQARRRIGGYLARGVERQFGRTDTGVPQGAQQRIMQRLSEGAQAGQPFGPKRPSAYRAPGKLPGWGGG